MPINKKMAYRRKKNYKRRRPIRRRRRARRSSKRNTFKSVSNSGYLISRAPRALPIGQKFKRTLRYCESNLGINPGVAGVLDYRTFSANGLYDPNISGVGHQPLGFDQLMLFYNHYTVIGSRIKATFINTDTGVPVYCGIVVSAASAPSTTSMTTLREQGNINVGILNKAGTEGCSLDLVERCSIKKFSGVSKILSEDDYRGTSGANPAEQVYYICAAAPLDTTDVASLILAVEIDYICVFTEPKEITGS